MYFFKVPCINKIYNTSKFIQTNVQIDFQDTILCSSHKDI